MGVISSVSEEGYRTRITAGGHTIVSDEPVSAGGTDQGPTPYDLIAAGLTACTSMTLHFYARRESIPLERVELEVRFDRKHANDCADCVTREGYIHQFDVKVKLEGPLLTQEQREKLLSVAKRCPVYKVLTSEIHITETLA